MLIVRWMVCLSLAWVACGVSADAGLESSHYTTGLASPDGIGKFYMGREISHVMGHLGAGWLERPERKRQERTDLLIAGQMYFHALVFLGCAGYVMNKDEHVRVDIFYRNASNKYKNLINSVFGFLFLLPIIIVTLVYSLETIEASWKMKEVSTEAGGLAYVFIQKTFLVLFPITLMASLINQLLKIKWK